MFYRLTLFLVTLTFSSTVIANPPQLKNDPKRPVEKISKDLGVTPEQFIGCFNNVNPSMGGNRPSSERVHANKDVLLPCLQKYNSNITNSSLDAIMDKYRPGGREAQRPIN